jgi:carbonic anhydrase
MEVMMKGNSVRSFISMLVFALAGFVAYASGDTSKPEHATPHWTYEGKEGPSHWGSLSPDYSGKKRTLNWPRHWLHPAIGRF